MTTMTATSDRLQVHLGNALIHIASTYPLVLGVILESVQNALDVNAKNVWVRINQKSGTITISDNGDGATVAKFREALESVCRSTKAQGKLGRFGRGLISPLGKCARFTFTSSSQGKGEFNEWTFVTKIIQDCADEPSIPRRSRQDITRNPSLVGRGVTLVGWNTEVALTGVTSDSRIGRISMDELVENILAKFSKVLLRLDTIVSVTIIGADGGEKNREVKATTCTGEPLEEVILGKRGKQTIFTLYRALKTSGVRKGRVLVGESGGDEFRIPLTEFSDTLKDMISSEAISALLSGVFEGDIVSDLIKLHPSRTRFEEDEGLLDFCLALDEWFKHVGKKHMSEAEQRREDELYQELGVLSLRHIEDLVMNGGKDSAELRKVIDSITVGNVGKGHKAPPKKDLVGKADQPALSINGAAQKGRSEGDGRETSAPDNEHEEHHPFTVAGPRGTVRQLVKGGSTGLQFQWVEMLESEALWDFDNKRGVLSFNTRSAAWLMCKDKGSKHIRQFQELVAIKALTLETMPDGWKEGARAQSEEEAKAYARLITQSDAFKARMQGM